MDFFVLGFGLAGLLVCDFWWFLLAFAAVTVWLLLCCCDWCLRFVGLV